MDSSKRLLVWLAILWAIWWIRNEIIFNAEVFDEGIVVHKAILLVWFWNVLSSKLKVYSDFYL